MKNSRTMNPPPTNHLNCKKLENLQKIEIISGNVELKTCNGKFINPVTRTK